MATRHHGLSVGLERFENDYFIKLKAVGKLTHGDYEKIIPILESALEGIKEPKIRVLFDAIEFQGWEARAAWDDVKLGLRHGSKFDKIAIYGNKEWQDYAAKIGSWFISGEAKFFEEYEQAIAYLEEE